MVKVTAQAEIRIDRFSIRYAYRVGNIFLSVYKKKNKKIILEREKKIPLKLMLTSSNNFF